MREYHQPKKSAHRRTWPLAFAWSLLLVAMAILVLPHCYGEADDPAIVDLLRSNFHVPFASLMFSRLMGWLYQYQPNVAWYALYHYLALSTCLALSLNLILQQPLSYRWRTFLLVVFATAFLGFVTRMTFTYSAILMGGLGILYLARQWMSTSRDIVTALGCGTLLALSFFTRWEALKAMVFFIPILGFAFWYLWRNNRQFLYSQAFGPLVLCFMLPLLLTLNVEKRLFQMTPAEKHFDQFMNYHENNIGFGISDFRQQPGLLQKIGWTPDDYRMYQHWLYLDEQKFSLQAVRSLSDATTPMAQQVFVEQFQLQHLPHLLYGVLSDGWFKHRQFAFLFLGMTLLVSLLALKRLVQAWAWGYLLLVLLGSVVVSALLRFPLRVAGPVYYVAALGLWCMPHLSLATSPILSHSILSQSNSPSPAKSRLDAITANVDRSSDVGGMQTSESSFSNLKTVPNLRVLLSLMVVALLLVPIGETIYQTWQITRKQTDFNTNYRYLAQQARGGYLLRESGLIPLKWLNPLEAKPPIFPEVSAGWAIFSVPYYMRLQQIGLFRAVEVLPWMIDKPNAVLLISPETVDTLPRYIQQVYGLNTQLLPVSPLPAPPHHPLYRLVSTPALNLNGSTKNRSHTQSGD